MKKMIKQRTRFYVAVEGEGEQSFIKWLQNLSDQSNLHIHLDCQLLSGGDYKTMLNNAVNYQKRKERNRLAAILLLDADRATRDDGWSLDRLREEANKQKFNLCLQFPNQEGLLLRLLPGNEHLQPEAGNTGRLLRRAWAEYQKPVDAYTLQSKFVLNDLLRVAKVDPEIKNLLAVIGLLTESKIMSRNTITA